MMGVEKLRCVSQTGAQFHGVYDGFKHLFGYSFQKRCESHDDGRLTTKSIGNIVSVSKKHVGTPVNVEGASNATPRRTFREVSSVAEGIVCASSQER